MKDSRGTGGGLPSRWARMGPASLWVILATSGCSAAILGFMWVSLRSPESVAPFWWSLGGVALCALGNLAGQSLALFGLFAGPRGRRRSLWALALGIAGLLALMAGLFVILWRRGLLGM